MKSTNYQTVEDFLKDPSFVSWVQKETDKGTSIWEQWSNDHPEKSAVIAEARDILLGIQFSKQEIPQEKVHLALNSLNKTLDSKTPTKRRVLRVLAAAGVIVLLLASTIAYLLVQPEFIVHQTAFGETLELRLQDSTEVSLNANSKIKYYPNQPREVWIEGEAFFKVAKKKLTKEQFFVHTDDLTIEVLGTEFNVHCRSEKTQVVLKEGKVNLQFENGEEKEMTPGDLITFSAKKDRIIEEKKSVKAIAHSSWKDGTLIFEDISLGAAMDRIAEIYGVDISYDDNTIASKRIHIGVPTTNLDICIKAMEIACGIKIEATEKKLIIKNSN